MIKNKILLILSIGCLFSQLPNDRVINVRNGVGFEFQTIGPLVAALSNSNSSSGSLFLPMVSNNFMIEPNIYYMYESDEYDYDSSDTISESYQTYLMFNVGLFFLNQRSDELRTYSGIRLGFGGGKSKSLYSGDETTGKALLIGPAIGAEYFISNYFSFGGECTFRISKSEEVTEGLVEKESASMLVPTLMVRFYF